MFHAHLKRTIALLVFGALLVGLGHAALLPPFEGFDETGHFAYIQQIADTGHWPVRGDLASKDAENKLKRGDPMSKDIDDYLKVAPTTDAMHGPWTYPAFFAAGPDTIERGRQIVQERPSGPRRFVPGTIGNWQAQHPPLYYLALAPAYLVSKSWSLAAQLFLLRSLSYLLAWAGLCIAAIAALRHTAMRDQPLAMCLPLGIALWPVMFPMWFPEMARLGNDSLITVFAACTFLLVYRISASVGTLRDHALLGAALGLALLTKATFLPVAAAVVVLLGFQIWFARHLLEQRARRLGGFVTCGVVALVICGWWYVAKYIETGSFIGSNDDANLEAAGGLIAALRQNADFFSVLRTPWGLAGSFLWSGTWSFVLPPRTTMLPLVFLAALIAFGCYRHLRQRTMQPIDWFALLTLGLFMVALVQHSLVLLALTGNPAPAWYLHSLAPILALLAGYGIASAAATAWSRRLLMAALVYSPIFLLCATLLNVLFYAGCIPLTSGRRYLAPADGLSCLADLPRMYDNLSVLALPGIGVVLFALGWIAMVIGIAAAVRLVGEGNPAAPRFQRAIA